MLVKLPLQNVFFSIQVKHIKLEKYTKVLLQWTGWNKRQKEVLQLHLPVSYTHLDVYKRQVSGNVTSQKLIIVGEKAEIKGDLSSKNVIVFGKLTGNVIAGEVQIKKSGTISGDISVQAIEIEMGGKYNGKLMMNAEQREMNEKLKSKESKNGVLID